MMIFDASHTATSHSRILTSRSRTLWKCGIPAFFCFIGVLSLRLFLHLNAWRAKTGLWTTPSSCLKFCVALHLRMRNILLMVVMVSFLAGFGRVDMAMVFCPVWRFPKLFSCVNTLNPFHDQRNSFSAGFLWACNIWSCILKPRLYHLWVRIWARFRWDPHRQAYNPILSILLRPWGQQQQLFQWLLFLSASFWQSASTTAYAQFEKSPLMIVRSYYSQGFNRTKAYGYMNRVCGVCKSSLHRPCGLYTVLYDFAAYSTWALIALVVRPIGRHMWDISIASMTPDKYKVRPSNVVKFN